QPVHILHVVPGFQCDHEVHAFLTANAFDAEHRRHVDDADAANFHVIAGELRAGADHFVSVHERDLGDVVGHKTVTAFDQGEHTFTFADAAFAADDHAYAEDVHHAAHLGAVRGEHHFQRERGQVDELHRDERTLKDRHVGLLRDFQKQFVCAEIATENDA